MPRNTLSQTPSTWLSRHGTCLARASPAFFHLPATRGLVSVKPTIKTVRHLRTDSDPPAEETACATDKTDANQIRGLAKPVSVTERRCRAVAPRNRGAILPAARRDLAEQPRAKLHDAISGIPHVRISMGQVSECVILRSHVGGPIECSLWIPLSKSALATIALESLWLEFLWSPLADHRTPALGAATAPPAVRTLRAVHWGQNVDTPATARRPVIGSRFLATLEFGEDRNRRSQPIDTSKCASDPRKSPASAGTLRSKSGWPQTPLRGPLSRMPGTRRRLPSSARPSSPRYGRFRADAQRTPAARKTPTAQ